MFRQSKDLKGLRLRALDGEIGHVKDFYFDDRTWTVRYLVADSGTWLPHRKVLISPFAVTGWCTEPHRALEVSLTKKQIEDSPSIETHLPVSRRFESQYAQYYGWPYYWPGPLLWGPVDLPGGYVPFRPRLDMPNEVVAESEDAHVRSAQEVTGYHLQGLDHQFGHVEQFVIEQENWAIRYLVVDTGNWWPGKAVLLSPAWISWVSWAELRVYVDFDRDTVRRSPEYDASQPITREYERALFAHYNREPYWETGDRPAENRSALSA
jgi:hypothetical protein